MKLMLLNLVLLLLVRDDGRYASSPLKPWFESLRNGWGQSCCDVAASKSWTAIGIRAMATIASAWPAAGLWCQTKLWCKGPTTSTKRSFGYGTKKL
jgi:hypothetical protein